MPNYLATLAFDGRDFHGWQLQPGLRTVQMVCEKAAETLFESGIRFTAAGRTDAGVHALALPASFKTLKNREPAVVRRALNALLPEDVRVMDCTIVADDFSARFDAVSRAYRYVIETAGVPNPINRRYAWQEPGRLLEDRMREALSALAGEHDFSAFRASDCASKSPVRRMIKTEMENTGDGRLEIFFEASGFLKHMVRSIVGTLMEIGRGDRPAGDMKGLLENPDRSRVGRTAPAHGLYFLFARYE